MLSILIKSSLFLALIHRFERFIQVTKAAQLKDKYEALMKELHAGI
jgi:hypothetical protein